MGRFCASVWVWKVVAWMRGYNMVAGRNRRTIPCVCDRESVQISQGGQGRGG